MIFYLSHKINVLLKQKSFSQAEKLRVLHRVTDILLSTDNWGMQYFIFSPLADRNYPKGEVNNLMGRVTLGFSSSSVCGPEAGDSAGTEAGDRHVC